MNIEQEIKNDLRQWNVLKISEYLKQNLPVNDLCIPNKTDILLEAMARDNLTMFKRAISKGYDFENSPFNHLNHAIRVNNIEYLKELLANTKNKITYLNKADNISGDTSLHSALRYDIKNKQTFIVWLSKNGASWNVKNIYGHTPLHILIREHSDILNESIINELIDKKADFSIQDNNNFSVLDSINSMALDKVWKNSKHIKLLLEKINYE